MKSTIYGIDKMTADEKVMIELTSLQDYLEVHYLKDDSDDYCCGDIEFTSLLNVWGKDGEDVINNYNEFIDNIDDQYNHNHFGGDDCLVAIDEIRKYMHDGINIKRDIDHVIPVNKEIVNKFDLNFLVEFYSAQQRYKDGIICSQFQGIERIFFDKNVASLVCTFYRSWRMLNQTKPSLWYGDNYDLEDKVLTIMENVRKDLIKEEIYIGGKAFDNLLNINEELLFRKHYSGDSNCIEKNIFYTQFGTCIEAEQ